MDLFGKKAIKQLKDELLEVKKIAFSQSQNIVFENIKANFNQNFAVYPKSSVENNDKKYCTTDDIYSIISMLAGTAARIPLYGYLVKDEQANKALNKIRQPHNKLFESKALEIKALEDLPENDIVQMLLDDPCPTCSAYEFYLAVYSFLFINGNAIILKERPETGINQGLTSSMYILYPQNVTLKVTDSYPKRIIGYDYTVNGIKVFQNIPPEDIIHLKYFNPVMDSAGSELWGLSPLDVLAKRLQRLDNSMDTSVAQLKNGGVETIVFDKGLPATEQAVNIVGQRKDNFYRFLRNPDNVGAPFFATGEMGAIQLGLSLANLSVLELAVIDFKKLCNAFGTSDILFNSDSASTESNVQIMEKRTYTNTVLPNVYRLRDALKASLLDEFEKGRSYEVINENGELETITIKGDGIKRELREDISEISSLQEDMLKMAQWMNVSPQVTYNERRLMMKFERLENPLFDEPFLPTGIQLASDLVIEPPIDGG